MVKIRLRRVGAKKQPSYRVVVADSRAPRDGRFIEIIGHYDPRQDPPRVVIFEDRALHWLSVGAQPSGPVAAFFEKLGLREKLRRVHSGEAIADVAEPRPKAPTAAGPDEVADVRPTRARRAQAKTEATTETPPVMAEAPDAAAAAAESAAEPVADAVAQPVQSAQAAVASATEAAEDRVEPAAPVAASPAPAAPAKKASGARPVVDLGLSARVAKALEAEGITDTDQLAARLAAGPDALLSIAGIGAKAVDEIFEKLQQRGPSAGA